MQTNSDLWLDRRLRTSACGTWWVAGTPGGHTLGTLALDPQLVAAPAARERVAAAVAAIRAVNPPGVLRTTDLFYDKHRAWLVVAAPPLLTLAELLAAVPSLPLGAASAIATAVAAALRELHAVGLGHGALSTGTVIVARGGAVSLAEAGVLAAVRDVPADVGRDAAAWGALARELAGRTAEPESGLLLATASTAESGDLAAAARRLALGAAEWPAFADSDALAAIVTTTEPGPAPVPAPRLPADDEPAAGDRVVVRLRFGPGVPDEALLNPRPIDIARPRRGRWRLVLGVVGAVVAVSSLAAAAGWWWFPR